jgi:hypothetical protein
MAIKETKTIEITCDYCKEKTEYNHKIISIEIGPIGQGTDQHKCFTSINLKGSIPYYTTDADICSKCAKKMLAKAIEKLDNFITGREEE